MGKVFSCNSSPMLWTDHTWVEYCFNTTAEKDLHRQWVFDTTILFTDYWKKERAADIEQYFQLNDMEDVSKSVIWDAMKVVVRGKVISISAAL